MLAARVMSLSSLEADGIQAVIEPVTEGPDLDERQKRRRRRADHARAAGGLLRPVEEATLISQYQSADVVEDHRPELGNGRQHKMLAWLPGGHKFTRIAQERVHDFVHRAVHPVERKIHATRLREAPVFRPQRCYVLADQ